jgi:hypothetical protein
MVSAASIVPEAFLDTPVINGIAYLSTTVEPRAYRFQVLNVSNGRFINLQLYHADSANSTEVKMVPAVKTTGFPATWPTDGRERGVPDPATAGPPMIQIGTVRRVPGPDHRARKGLWGRQG